MKSGRQYFYNIDLAKLKVEIYNLAEEVFEANPNENLKLGKFSKEFNCKISVFQEDFERVYDFGAFGEPLCVNLFFHRFGGEVNYFYVVFRDMDVVENQPRPSKTGIFKRLIVVSKKIIEKRNKEVENNSMMLRKVAVIGQMSNGNPVIDKRIPGISFSKLDSDSNNEKKSNFVQDSDKSLSFQYPKVTKTLPLKLSINNAHEKSSIKNSFSSSLGENTQHLFQGSSKHPVKKGSIIYKFQKSFMENEEVKDYCVKNNAYSSHSLPFSQDFSWSGDKNFLNSEKDSVFISSNEENRESDKFNVSFDGSPENCNRFQKNSEILMPAERSIGVKNMIYNMEAQELGKKYLKIFPYDPKSKPPYNIS